MTEGEMVGRYHRFNGHEFYKLWELVMYRVMYRLCTLTVLISFSNTSFHS